MASSRLNHVYHKALQAAEATFAASRTSILYGEDLVSGWQTAKKLSWSTYAEISNVKREPGKPMNPYTLLPIIKKAAIQTTEVTDLFTGNNPDVTWAFIRKEQDTAVKAWAEALIHLIDTGERESMMGIQIQQKQQQEEEKKRE